MDFFEKICEISPLSSETTDSLSKHLKRRAVGKGELLLASGDRAESIAFIESGSMRLYYLTQDGKEFNQAFKFEGDLVAGYASLLTSEPCNFNIEALEDSQVLLLPFEEISKRYKKHPSLERLGRKVAEQHFLNKEKREASFLLLSASSRYQELLKEKPFINKRVPQYHIASYLGITAESFNRLLKEFS